MPHKMLSICLHSYSIRECLAVDRPSHTLSNCFLPGSHHLLHSQWFCSYHDSHLWCWTLDYAFWQWPPPAHRSPSRAASTGRTGVWIASMHSYRQLFTVNSRLYWCWWPTLMRRWIMVILLQQSRKQHAISRVVNITYSYIICQVHSAIRGYAAENCQILRSVVKKSKWKL